MEIILQQNYSSEISKHFGYWREHLMRSQERISGHKILFPQVVRHGASSDKEKVGRHFLGITAGQGRKWSWLIVSRKTQLEIWWREDHKQNLYFMDFYY